METVLETSQCHVSKFISREMKLNWKSQYSCYLKKNEMLIQEHLHLIAVANAFECIEGGSDAEGTNTFDSDLDRMIIMPDITVHTCKKKQELTKGHSFVLDEAGCSSGYGRLRVLKFEETKYPLFGLDSATIRAMCKETTDGKFLSSEKFVMFFVTNMTRRFNEKFCRHGPCAAAEEDTFVESNPDSKIERDIAHVLVCDAWPTDARQWITRKRKHNWPPKDIIRKISRIKCHAVPVGNKRSSNFPLEWRISFLLAERELVWNFNDTQVQCYILLKFIIKKHIEPIAPDQLSSYHMKTIMFWMAEEQGMSMWYEENLIGCLIECVNMLSHCVKKQNLQHYFNKKNNLLDDKLDNGPDKTRVLAKIDEIKTDIQKYVSEYLEGYEISSEMCRSCQNTHINGKNKSYSHQEYEEYQKASNVLKLYRIIFSIYITIVWRYNDCIDLLYKSMCREKNNPEGVDSVILEMAKVFIHLRLGISYFRQTFASGKECFQQRRDSAGMPFSMGDAYNMLNRGRNMDSLSWKLYLASSYLCEDKFASSNDLILSVLKHDILLVYPGRSSSKCAIHLTEEGKAELEQVICFYGTQTLIAYDVIFSSDDTDFVPYPVKFECVLTQKHKYNYILIHPCIYAYFLLCVGQFCDGQFESCANTLKHLDHLVCELDGTEKYRALNLLGYCYSLGGNVNAALRCYSSSLKLTQSSPVIKNAAVYHICIILAKYFNVSRGPNVLYERQKKDS